MISTRALRFDGKADAYLEWAVATDFSHLQTWPSAVGEHSIGLLVQKLNGAFATTVWSVNDATRPPPAEVSRLRRLALASPIGADAPEFKPSFLKPLAGLAHAPLVMGIIDDGCPFAQPALQSRDDGLPRVWALWDQNPGPGLNRRRQYGRLFNRALLKRVIDMHPGDDIAAYEALHMRSLRKRQLHGSHVLDLMCGPLRPRALLSPSRETLQGGDGSATLAPSWETASDEASQAPILFVQLPRDAIEDPTGRWLGFFVLDAVDFMIAAMLIKDSSRAVAGSANTVVTRKLVVNISWGPQTGPHDGSSLIELALDQRVVQARQSGIELTVVLPVGNTFEARSHASFDVGKGCDRLLWNVPPGLRAPAFLELWWPSEVKPEQVKLEITPPGNASAIQVTVPVNGAVFALDAEQRAMLTVLQDGERTMALLALAPTDPHSTKHPASHGCWCIKVDPIIGLSKDDLPVHAYVARQVNNLGASRRNGPDSFLLDPDYELWRQWRRPDEDPPQNTLVDCEGTLNGIATGRATKVIAGYVLNQGKANGMAPASPYSSSGPGAVDERDPDAALPSDETSTLRGLRASGVRQGTTFRLVGTSTAAPQAARKAANGDIEFPTRPSKPARQGLQAIRRRRRLGPNGPTYPVSDTPVSKVRGTRRALRKAPSSRPGPKTTG